MAIRLKKKAHIGKHQIVTASIMSMHFVGVSNESNNSVKKHFPHRVNNNSLLESV